MIYISTTRHSPFFIQKTTLIKMYFHTFFDGANVYNFYRNQIFLYFFLHTLQLTVNFQGLANFISFYAM